MRPMPNLRRSEEVTLRHRCFNGLLSALLLITGPRAQATTADFERTPILMVHGWFVIDNAGLATWASMKKKLVQDGWPEEYIATPTFRDVRGCDPEHAEEIAQWVEDLRTRTGFDRVDIVAHSEGALNTLWYLKRLCGIHKVRKFVAVAGAFHGTVVACLDPFSCGSKEMCIPSGPEGWKKNETLAELNACDETPGDVLYTSIWSPWDEIIVPPEGGALAGSEVIVVQTPFTGHGGVLFSDEVYGYVREALLNGGANDDGPSWDCIPECAVSEGNPEQQGVDYAEVAQLTEVSNDIFAKDIIIQDDIATTGFEEPLDAEADAGLKPDSGPAPTAQEARALPSLGGCKASSASQDIFVFLVLFFIVFVRPAKMRRTSAQQCCRP